VTDESSSTRPASAGTLRRAEIGDVSAIQRILKSFADQGDMLPRSLGELYENLRDFVVWEQDGELVACCALHVTWENLAEVKSLGVTEPVQGKGIGTELVKQCLEDARSLKVTRVFALTYRPDFFARLGFAPIDKSLLPHKVWAECIRCVKFPDCDEQAVLIDLADTQ